MEELLMILKTKRLMLREMCETDFDDLCQMLCDEEVMYAYAHAFCLEEAREWLKRQLQRYQEDGVGLWAMIRLEDQVMVGQCGITRQHIEGEDVWEIGYLLKKEFWHQGYAIEAAKACKWYAFDTLKLPCVYSIIREDNEASRKVASANAMKVCGEVVKHYYGMDMPHVIYRVDNHKFKEAPMYRLYMDAEFDAVKIQRKFHQRVISIGAVISDVHGQELGRFYETVYPQQFQRLTRVVHRMTKLSDETIRSSRSLKDVMEEFSKWMYGIVKKRSQVQMFSFGPDDKRTILQHCTFENIDTKDIFQEVMDIQKLISPHVTYQGKIVSPTLSLDDMKLVFEIHGEVEHNALTDSLDLMAIHVAFDQHKAMNEENIQAIVNRKIQKQIESKKKQQAHFRKVMQERFKEYPRCIEVEFNQEIFDQFQSWEMKDRYFKWHFKKNFVRLEDIDYPYTTISMKLSIDTNEELPSVTLDLKTEEQNIKKKYVLSYHNATPIENIIRRVGNAHE